MDEWTEIRRRVLVEGVSRRQILRETGLHWLTLKKILAHSEPPGYRQQKARRKRKLGAYVARIEQILKEGQRRGVFKQMNLKPIPLLLISALRGIETHLVEVNDPPSLEKGMDTLLGLFFEGICQ